MALQKSVKRSTFQWEGLDQAGRFNRGDIQAPSEIQARAELRRLGIKPGLVQKRSPYRLVWKQPRIKPRDIAIFTRQLATLLTAGVPLVQAFDIIGRGHEQAALRQLLLLIRTDIEKGTPLAESLARHPRHFDTLFCNLVHAGEQAGILDTLLVRIADHQEKTEALKNRIRSAMSYPLLVTLVSAVVVSILLIFVVPQFESLFRGFGAALPPVTQWILDGSRGLETHGPWLLGLLTLAGYGVVRLKDQSEAFNQWLDERLLDLPLIGNILHKSAVARTARTLSALSTAGVPLVEALPSVAGAAGNRRYAAAIQDIRRQVATGSSLQQALLQTRLFPDMLIQMVAIGEESGTLDGMLARVADFYEEDVDNAVNAMSKLMEPAIMVILGGLVGGLVLAMYLPLFQLGGVM